MNAGNEADSILAREVTISGRMELLTICDSGEECVGDALETAFRSVPEVRLVREELPGRSPAVKPDTKKGTNPSVILLCISGDFKNQLEATLESIQKVHPDLPIVVVARTIDAVGLHRLINTGIADFSLTPVRLEDLMPRVMRWSRNSLSRQLDRRFGMQQLLGSSRAFVEAVQKIPRIALCDASVLITGETGTGKEMCARAIHQLGPRADYPFVPVNCGAIPTELVENELFGHTAGAFTSAASSVPGLVCHADGGTLFLDEIDSLPPQTQVKFLRFLQDREYRPLGGRKSMRADIRVIAASNADLEEAVCTRRFRSDLFYRLNVLPLKLPALRERRDDIPLLAQHFLRKYTVGRNAGGIKELSRAALEKLTSYEWPGNVRELENFIERATVMSEQSLIKADDICLPGSARSLAGASFKMLKARAIEEFETAYARQVLAANDGNISKAARAAQKNRRAFWQLLRKHGLTSPNPAVR